jgi:hypothetical protein
MTIHTGSITALSDTIMPITGRITTEEDGPTPTGVENSIVRAAESTTRMVELRETAISIPIAKTP